jgi:asparagine synthetase B (glutamine-hydrolysing)
MCGIFGVITGKNTIYSNTFLNNSLKTLALLSESRGKDSSGICLFNAEQKVQEIIKGPVPVSNLLKNQKLKEKLDIAFTSNNIYRYAFGHARLVTNGTQLNDENNQPVVKDGIVAIHNGIIVNVNELWSKYSQLNRQYEIDTEVLLSVLRHHLQNRNSLEQSLTLSFAEIFGTASVAMVFNDLDKFALATNNGSLYVLHNNKDILFFASEKFMLLQFAKKTDLTQIGSYKIYAIKTNEGAIINFDTFGINHFSLRNPENRNPEIFIAEKYVQQVHPVLPEKKQRSTVVDLNYIHLNPKAIQEQTLLQYPVDKIKELKRCSTCLLPETFPFIEFDDHGECNYCKNYKPKNQHKPISELQKLVEPFRKNDGSPDVLIPFSGGRDSTYVLHVVKEELGLNPVTYTYDWGMVTDLARRNIARICGKLGIENIIVAANIHWKRENIRKNIAAWLKSPSLGMIPLFMAGDKFFFYYAHKIKKQLGVDLEIWGINELENTNFKTGFAGLRPQFDKKRIYSLSIQNQLKLFGFVGKNLLQSPGYINQSVFDSLGSFASRYLTPKPNYYHLFDYVQWDEKTIEDTIIGNYDWEKAVDTNSTWRIGDGTASFYNYIYTLVAGFSENDTFRSNQIREGMISREKALELIYEENKPRYNSIKWYLEIVGLDFEAVIKKINQIPRLYN